LLLLLLLVYYYYFYYYSNLELLSVSVKLYDPVHIFAVHLIAILCFFV